MPVVDAPDDPDSVDVPVAISVVAPAGLLVPVLATVSAPVVVAPADVFALA